MNDYYGGNVVTLSLQWVNMRNTNEPLCAIKNARGQFTGKYHVPGWNMKICGLLGTSIDINYNDVTFYTERERGVLEFHISRGHLVNCKDGASQLQAIEDEKNDIPMECITRYLTELQSVRYKIISAPTAVGTEHVAVWTLSNQRQEVKVLPQPVPAKKHADAYRGTGRSDWEDHDNWSRDYG